MGITLNSILVCIWNDDKVHKYRDLFKATAAHVGPSTRGKGWREAHRMERIAFKRGLKNLEDISWNIPDVPHYAVSIDNWGGFNDELQHTAYKEICEYLDFPSQYANYDKCSYAGYKKGSARTWTHSPDFDGMKFTGVVKFIDYVFEHWMIIDLPREKEEPVNNLNDVKLHELKQGNPYVCRTKIDVDSDDIMEFLFIFDEIRENTEVWGENWINMTNATYDRGEGWANSEESNFSVPSSDEMKWHAQCINHNAFFPYIPVEPIKTHNKFPEEGFTRATVKRLRDFLNNRDNSVPVKEAVRGEVIGIAWNKNSAWTVSLKSSKHEYSWSYISQLIINLNSNNQLKTSKNNEKLPTKISRPSQGRSYNGTRQTTKRRKPNSTTKRCSGVEESSGKTSERSRQIMRSQRDRLSSNPKLSGRYSEDS